MFFQYLRVTPALRSVKLSNHRRILLDADLVDPVFITVEGENACIGNQPELFHGADDGVWVELGGRFAAGEPAELSGRFSSGEGTGRIEARLAPGDGAIPQLVLRFAGQDIQLADLPEARIRVAGRYRELLAELPVAKGATTTLTEDEVRKLRSLGYVGGER